MSLRYDRERDFNCIIFQLGYTFFYRPTHPSARITQLKKQPASPYALAKFKASSNLPWADPRLHRAKPHRSNSASLQSLIVSSDRTMLDSAAREKNSSSSSVALSKW